MERVMSNPIVKAISEVSADEIVALVRAGVALLANVVGRCDPNVRDAWSCHSDTYTLSQFLPFRLAPSFTAIWF